MRLGFTGRALGITLTQHAILRTVLRRFTGWDALHNDGEGSDQVFAQLAAYLGLAVEVTPSELSPMPRNRYLVAHSDVLIAVPPTDFIVKKGSGTWETVKYMWKAGKPVHIILSDGRIFQTKDDFVGGVGIEPT